MVRRVEQRNFLWQQRKLRQAERSKLPGHPQITGAVARELLRGPSLRQQRLHAPLPIADRIYRALRWTKQGALPWLLLVLLAYTPMVRAQSAGFDRQAVEILGTVFVDGGNRPVGGAIVSIRSLTGGPFVSVLADWGGRFQVQGLSPGMYEIVVEEAGYEPTRKTLQVYEPSAPLELYLKASKLSPARPTDFTVSVRELRIPAKARDAFEKGLERLAKNDADGSRRQFERATTAFPDYYEAHYHMGVAHLRLGREEEASKAFQKAIDLSGGRYAWAQFGLGLVLCQRGDYAEGETAIRRGLEVDGNSATGHLFLSVSLLHLNRAEEAEKSAREALVRKPGSALAYLVLADIHARRGEYALQLHELDAYLKLAPDGPASNRVREVRDVVQATVLRTKN